MWDAPGLGALGGETKAIRRPDWSGHLRGMTRDNPKPNVFIVDVVVVVAVVLLMVLVLVLVLVSVVLLVPMLAQCIRNHFGSRRLCDGYIRNHFGSSIYRRRNNTTQRRPPPTQKRFL